MNILDLFLSKKILVVLSGFAFTGVVIASSGAESLFKEGGTIAPETKIPEVQNITVVTNSPSPTPTLAPKVARKTPQKSSPVPTSTPQPAVRAQTNIPSAISATPKPVITPKPVASTGSQTTITGLRQSQQPANQEAVSGKNSIEQEEDEAKEDEESSEPAIKRAFQQTEED